ncbi:MAG: hypothetical protein KA715_05130 [Xanthomonadaceae bacterium]|nr:hypothetical protein [Xanthomonadaceae bacterium]
MSLQASKIGSSALSVDWSGLQVMTIDSSSINTAWTKAKARITKKDSDFYSAPIDYNLSQINESINLAEKILESKKFTDCLFLGIGGSALGPITLLSSLEHLRTNEMGFHFVENPDAIDWNLKLKKLNPETTLVVVVTKSGTTYETIAQFLIALQWLKPERVKSNMIAITDPSKGDLKTWATKNQIPTLHIAPTIGGRFSIFTPVGLFAAKLAGLDPEKFLHGASQIREYCENTESDKNVIFTTFERIFTLSERQPIHVLMPYSTRLKLMGSWWVQLWGESLGKDSKGYTPVAGVGATDQHSLLQLLRDGPNDKITGFVNIHQVDDPAMIPSTSQGPYSSFEQLRGHSLHKLLNVEHQAIARVLSRRPRPNWTLTIEKLDESAMGAALFFFCVGTAYIAERLGVNPYDQPGVEEGKLYIRELLK